MTPLQKLGYLITADLAVDLGTVNTLIYSRGRGIVLNEPTAVAIDEVTGEIVAVGAEAVDMEGREPEGFKVVRPVQHGVVTDLNLTGTMLQHFIRRARGSRARLSRRMLIGAPSGATEVERNAIREAAHASAVGRVYLVEEGLAAALGSGIDLTGPEAHMVVDIGGGTTGIAVVGSNGVIFSWSERLGGLDLDEAIVRMIRDRHGVHIGPRTAERVKMELGCAVITKSDATTKVMGRRAHAPETTDSRLASATVKHQQVCQAISPILDQIIATVRQCLEELEPEVAADVLGRGIILTGGTALLPRMPARLEAELALPVRAAENPLLAVAQGMGRLFGNAKLLRHVVRRQDITRYREYLTAAEAE